MSETFPDDLTVDIRQGIITLASGGVTVTFDYTPLFRNGPVSWQILSLHLQPLFWQLFAGQAMGEQGTPEQAPR